MALRRAFPDFKKRERSAVASLRFLILSPTSTGGIAAAATTRGGEWCIAHHHSSRTFCRRAEAVTDVRPASWWPDAISAIGTNTKCRLALTCLLIGVDRK